MMTCPSATKRTTWLWTAESGVVLISLVYMFLILSTSMLHHGSYVWFKRRHGRLEAP